MSTILKALRRLEEEKAAGEEARPLREQIASEPRMAVRPRRTGWAAAAVALVLGVGAGGGVIWWLFGRSAAPTQIAAVPAPAPASPAVPAPAPAVAAVDPGLPNQAFESDVEIVDRPDALPRIPDANPIEPSLSDPKPGSVRPVLNSSAAERARQAALAEYNAAERARRGLPPEAVPAAPPAPLDPITAEPSPEPDVAQAAPPAPAPSPVPIAAASPAPAPVAPAPVAAPSPKPKAAAPAKVAKPAPPKEAPAPPSPSIAVSVEKTQWHPLADRRIAWLNVPGASQPQRVVEGDVVDGLIVSKIEPSGVVFERDGEKIRRSLGKVD